MVSECCFFSSGKHLNKLLTRQWEKTNKMNYTRGSPSEVKSRDFSTAADDSTSAHLL